MKGLIIKDFLTMKSALKTYAIISVFYLLFGFFTNNSSMIGILTVLFAMAPITSIAYDERSRFNHYALTMPISKLDLVLSKYIVGLILTIPAALIYIVSILFIENGMSFFENISVCAAFVLLSLLFQAIILPIMFKFGTEKGRIYMMIVFFAPTIIAFPIANSPLGGVIFDAFKNASPAAIGVSALFIIMAIYILSVIISVNIVKKKNF